MTEMRALVHVPMRARAADEEHRVSTPFELLFDLVFVVAIASLVTQFAHAVVEGQLADHTGPFLMVFFAIWWAWLNFTWFSSGYDSGDVVYRLLGVVQMGGVLVLAAGVPAAFENIDYRVITIGYLIMRLGQVGLWIRAAVEHPATRHVSTRYAIGITVVQILWLLRLLLPLELQVLTFAVLVLAEFLVPVWANRSGDDPWNPRHIAERYGLFVIIILGEGVLAASNGVQAALADSAGTGTLIVVGVAGLLILVGLWWVYFLEVPEEGLARRSALTYYWGYGHVLLFAALAAVGAGLEVGVEVAGHHTEIAPSLAGWVVAVPVALSLVLIWALNRPLSGGNVVPAYATFPAAGLMLLAPVTTGSIGVAGVLVVVALLTAAVVAVSLATGRRSDTVDTSTK
ncbi:low temperature requirement protein A [soil metagenome]